MSQRDLVAELRGSRIAAPAELRAHVRSIAAGAPAPRQPLHVAPRARRRAAGRRGDRRRARRHAARQQPDRGLGRVGPGDRRVPRSHSPRLRSHSRDPSAAARHRSRRQSTPGTRAAVRRLPRAARADADGVSDGVKRALHIASSLGGYPTSVHANSHGKAASADLTLKIPRTHVQAAITRLSALGTITSEQVDVQDVQAGLNATDRTIARLQAQLATLRAADADDRGAGEDRRADRADPAPAARRGGDDPRRALRDVSAAPARRREGGAGHHGHGPLHGLGVALRWLGIGAVYALAIGAAAAPARRARLARRCARAPPPRERAAQPVLICANTRNVGSPTGSS